MMIKHHWVFTVDNIYASFRYSFKFSVFKKEKAVNVWEILVVSKKLSTSTNPTQTLFNFTSYVNFMLS